MERTRPLTENELGMLCEVCMERRAVKVNVDASTAVCGKCRPPILSEPSAPEDALPRNILDAIQEAIDRGRNAENPNSKYPTSTTGGSL